MKSQKLMMTRVAMLLLAVFTSMGAWAESWDSGDCQVTLEGSTLTVSGSGAMADYGSATEVPWRTHKDNIKTVVVGNGVTHIGVFSFYGCESLESVTIPNSVTSIGNFAFYGCHGINSLTLPDNLTTIGNNAFYNCSAIPTLNIPNSVTSIGNQAFWECYSLICVTIGTGVTSIGYSAFEDCTHLATVVVFATSVPTLGNENVFGNNADGRYIYVPNGSLGTYKSNWNAYSANIDSFVETGDCSKTSSDNVKWVSAGSKMVVYGSGAMADYSSSGQGPWPHETPKRVIIEEGVTTIGNYAFAGHGKTTHTVTIPNTVQTIGTNAFSGCSNIETLTIGSGVKTIGNGAFNECSNINSLTLPDGLETIGNDAFADCSSIPSVTIPSSVTSIGEAAFSDCSKLATVTFAPASSVTTIGNYAFSDCVKLESITIPSSVTSIGEQVFGGCSKLSSISVESGNTVYDSGNGCNAIIKTSSHTLIAGCQNTTIPNTVTTIGNYAFDDVDGLTSIEIPSSVTSLGERAFYDCDLLASITIPSSVTSIGDNAFWGCRALSTVVILPASLELYGKRVFEYNKSDRKIYVPNGSLSSYKGVANWSDFKDDIYGYTGAGDCGDNVKWVFADMDGNSTGETMVIYGSGAMADYSSAANLPWKNYKSSITTLIIEEGVTRVCELAFIECSNLTTVTFSGSSSVESIGLSAFNGCGSLASITIPSSVTSIGNFAFKGCRALATVTFSDQSSVTTIGNYAFSNCAELESITIPSSVTSIGEFVFSGCGKLTSISVESGNTKYDSGNGCNAIIETSSHTLIAGCQNTTIPNTVTSIGNNAFNNSALTSITIPSCVTSIGIYAFSGCGALTTVTFSGQSSVTTIGNYAFSDCAKLESITIPSSVTSIGEFVFSGCGKLTSISVESGNTKYDSGNGCNAIIETSSHTLIAGCQSTTIPNTVESIGNSAFYNCISLTSIEIPSSVTSIGDYAFVYCGALETVTFSGSSKVTSIGERAFEDCEKLESITIPSSVTSIGDYAFMYCRALATVTFSGQSSVTSIGDYAFNNCALTSIAIPSSVTSIGNYAFGGCSALATVTFSGPTSSVGSIGKGAFCWCGTLTSITLPATVTSIGQSAFESCSNLTSATLNSNPTIGNNAFGSGVALTMNLAASASNGYKWASFFNDYCNFQVDENTTVFKAKSNGEKVTLTAIADGIIPAGTAVVLRTPTDSSPVLTNTSSSTSGSYEDNELKGSSTAVTQEGAHTYYALAVKSGNVGLYKVKSNAKIPAGKAYLEDVIATTRDFLAFEDSEPTGIVDGRWNMEEGRGDGWYTLDGRKLNGKPKKKGMYVVNGNKVVIK